VSRCSRVACRASPALSWAFGCARSCAARAAAEELGQQGCGGPEARGAYQRDLAVLAVSAIALSLPSVAPFSLPTLQPISASATLSQGNKNNSRPTASELLLPPDSARVRSIAAVLFLVPHLHRTAFPSPSITALCRQFVCLCPYEPKLAPRSTFHAVSPLCRALSFRRICCTLIRELPFRRFSHSAGSPTTWFRRGFVHRYLGISQPQPGQHHQGTLSYTVADTDLPFGHPLCSTPTRRQLPRFLASKSNLTPPNPSPATHLFFSSFAGLKSAFASAPVRSQRNKTFGQSWLVSDDSSLRDDESLRAA
jgi:hypothetical protein